MMTNSSICSLPLSLTVADHSMDNGLIDWLIDGLIDGLIDWLICVCNSGDEHNEARFFFEAVKEGDQILFGTEEELERTMWVNKLYMATGQSHKPIAPKLSMVATAKESKTNTLGRAQGGTILKGTNTCTMFF